MRRLLLFCAALLIHQCSGQFVMDNDLKRFLGTLEPYELTANEVIFVLDESGSIGAENFHQVKLFTELIARQFSISSGFSRIGIITFATEPRVHVDYLKKSEGKNMCTLLKDIERINYVGAWTYTDIALKKAEDMLLQSRNNANKILVLLTDGKSNDGHSPVDIAEKLKKSGVIIFAVGVADINEKELKMVATSEDHIYILKDFLYIYNITKFLKEETKEVHWDLMQDSSMCNSFCEAGIDCCDVNADCYCGTKGGSYECTCKAGYFGIGHKGHCKPCPKGTFKDEAGVKKCEPCPINSATSLEGSTSIGDCVCNPGYNGNPGHGQPCEPVKCEKLQAPEGGVLLPPNCNNVYGSQCTFKCNEGYCPNLCKHTKSVINEGTFPWNLQNEEPRSCLETGLWTGTGFHCEKIRCPALIFPQNGNHNCTGLHEPFTFNTTCQLSCDKGYHLIGSNTRICLINGVWSGEETYCKPVTCGRLKTNEKLKVKLSKCGNEEMPYGSTCQFYCQEGFNLTSHNSKNTTVGIRKCLANGKWSGQEESIFCKDILHPKITCPAGAFTVATESRRPDALVEWNVPSVTDNVGVKEIKIIHPPGIRKPPHRFPIGLTKIVYEATDFSKLSSTCNFTVVVLDLEPPRVKRCPEDIEKKHDKKESIVVTWEEPVFVDNSGSLSTKYQNRESGGRFQWGPPSKILYQVADASGNQASCSFSVKIKPYSCPYAEPPTNGFLACDKWADGQFCQVYCNKGYAFAHTPENVYHCMQSRRQWGKLLGKKFAAIKFPWPDCSKIHAASAMDITFNVSFSVNDCSHTDEGVQKIKEKFVQSLKEYNKLVRGFCSEKIGCEVRNVNVSCGIQTFTTKVKRDIVFSSQHIQHQQHEKNAVERHRTFLVTNFTNKHRHRHAHSRRSVSSSTMHIVFTIEASQDDEIIPITTSTPCENCSQTSEELTERFHDFAENLKDKFTDDVYEVFKESSPAAPAISYGIVPKCQLGQININNSCVNCPVGTYYSDSTKDCIECPVGSYQHEESSLSCHTCPKGMSTLHTRSKYVEDCIAPCQLGTFSNTGWEPCIACPKDEYQDNTKSTECKVCPSKLQTPSIGSSSVKDCVGICPSGSFSSNGYEPCDKCPLGMYQPDAQQTFCLSCPNGTTTTSSGAHVVQYCRSVQFCEDLHPCYSGSICVNLVDGYECICEEGRIGKNCDVDVDDCGPDLCYNGGSCVDGINNFTCVCPIGFRGSQCEINTDDCTSGPCQNDGICSDLINDYFCTCPKGFIGKNCEINDNECLLDPCKNGGKCFDKKNGFKCCCPKEFIGSTCEVKKNICDEQQCLNRGICQPKGDGFSCNCPPGFTGKTCEIDVDECTDDYCKNGGTCIDGINRAFCNCPLFYAGEHCEKALSAEYGISFTSLVTSNYISLLNTKVLFAITVSIYIKTSYQDINNKGTPLSYSYKNFKSGTIQDNALTIMDMNELVLYLHGQIFHTGYKANSDSNWHHYAVTWDRSNGEWALYVDAKIIANGTHVGQNQYLWPGMFVLGQEQDDIGSGFSISEAFVGDITQFNVWDYAMSSEEVKQLSSACGFVGNLIEWPSSRLNIHGDVKVFNDIDLCSSLQSCSNISCNCMYSKTLSGAVCKSTVPTCVTNPCANGQKCVKQNQFFFCDCEEGYDGRFCQYDVDECLVNNGNCSHVCHNTPGSHQCSCPDGMVLKTNGRTCKDASFCKIGEQIFLDGEKWTSSCSECRCYEGDIICLEKSCPNITCPMDEVAILLPGNCCTSCVKQSPACVIRPNNSFITFDSKEYEFKGNCRYTFVEDCFDGIFSIHFELGKEEINIKHLIIYVNCLKVRIFPDGLIDVNNDTIVLPFKNDDVEIKSSNSSVTVTAVPGFSVVWDTSGFVTVTVPQSLKKRVCGLCGNFNGDTIDDQVTKQNMPARTASEMIHSWKVEGYKYCSKVSSLVQAKKPSSKVTSKFEISKSKNRYSTAFLACGDMSDANYFRTMKAMSACNILKKKNFRRCHMFVNPKPFYLLCLQDACTCKANVPCFCDSISAYVTECRKKNVVVRDWSTFNMCDAKCSGGMIYDECGPACPTTCFNSKTSDISCSRRPCTAGCRCPAHTVLHNGLCIPRRDCPVA